MSFTESLKICLGQKYLFRIQGRASRSEFWWFMLFIFLADLASGFIFSFLPPMLGDSLVLTLLLVLFPLLALSIVLFPPYIGVCVRRLHDRNMRGWWIMLPVVALFFRILAGDGQATSADMAANLLCLAMCVGYLIILALPGQNGPNRFGPDPLAGSARAR